MSRKSINITKDRIIGSLKLYSMPKNRINKVEVNYEEFSKNENLIISEKDITINEGTNLSFSGISNKPIKYFKSLYPDNTVYNPSGNLFNYDYNPSSTTKYENHTKAHYTVAYPIQVDFDLSKYAPILNELGESFYISYNYNVLKQTIKKQYINYIQYESDEISNQVKTEELLEEEYITSGSKEAFEVSSFDYDSGVFIKITNMNKIDTYVLRVNMLVTSYYRTDIVQCKQYTTNEDGVLLGLETDTNYYPQNIKFQLKGIGYDNENKTLEVKSSSGTDTKLSNTFTINSDFINNQTFIKGTPANASIANEIFETYKSGRIYGDFNTFYTSFKYTDDTSALSGIDGKLIRVGDFITFTDYLPDIIFIVTSAEFDATSGNLLIQFIKKMREQTVICSETTICSNTLII